MKKAMTAALCSLALCFAACAQQPTEEAIKGTITAFAKAADNNDVAELSKHLDKNYQILMNRMFGSTEVSVMDRTTYLEKIRSGEFGGDKRTITFKEVLLNGNTAVAKVVLAGEKATFISLLKLVQNEQGQWKLVSDVPILG